MKSVKWPGGDFTHFADFTAAFTVSPAAVKYVEWSVSDFTHFTDFTAAFTVSQVAVMSVKWPGSDFTVSLFSWPAGPISMDPYHSSFSDYAARFLISQLTRWHVMGC